MSPPWALFQEAAPPAGATEHQNPGSFRQHEIAEFHGGMQPPSWPFVEAEITAWAHASAELRPLEPLFPEQQAANRETPRAVRDERGRWRSTPERVAEYAARRPADRPDDNA